MSKYIVLLLLLLCPLSVAAALAHHQLVIIGSGPAGLSAAIFAGQAGLQPLVIEGVECDGQLDNVGLIENYPGFPEGIQSEELYERLHAQAQNFGALFCRVRVQKAIFVEKPFTLELENGDVVKADSVIIALGSKVKWLGLPSEQALLGKGVSSSALCDAPQFADKRVVVVGSADSALEQALLLADYASHVTLLARSHTLSGNRYLQEKVLRHPKIEVLYNSAVAEVDGVTQGHVTGVVVKDLEGGSTHMVACEGLFVAIGRTPNSDLFKGQLEMNAAGFLLTRSPTTQTSVPGVFAAGDIADTLYRKLITAAASGCQAALDAISSLGTP